MHEQLHTPALVIGCGIAGGTAALQLADAGLPVVVIGAADDPHATNTWHAQGGIVYRGRDDRAAWLVEDILLAGAGANRHAAVRLLARKGPRLVEQVLLERLGVAFDREADGALALTLEGGHRCPRIIHVADATGQALQRALIDALRSHPRVTLLSGQVAAALLTTPDRRACAGALCWDGAAQQWRLIVAGATVLATGGLAAIYRRSSNPPAAVGSGIALAAAVGARLADLEYIQFHPTALALPDAPAYLISEAVRGAGARLINDVGEPFMERYAPQWRDLAPRDVVARAIASEMTARALPHVWLDLAGALPAEQIRQRFPTITACCATYGLDITSAPIPVAPAAHYTCGGVAVDTWGRTSLPGLYAVGEVAGSGLHGANRLASTSLLEGLVWGTRAAQHILYTRAAPPPYAPPALPQGTAPPQPEVYAELRACIGAIMERGVGLVRQAAGLRAALDQLSGLRQQVLLLYHTQHPNTALLRLRDAAESTVAVTQAALRNRHSRGCHYRSDAPAVDEQARWTSIDP
jgi:L-aspartate oxidase